MAKKRVILSDDDFGDTLGAPASAPKGKLLSDADFAPEGPDKSSPEYQARDKRLREHLAQQQAAAARYRGEGFDPADAAKDFVNAAGGSAWNMANTALLGLPARLMPGQDQYAQEHGDPLLNAVSKTMGYALPGAPAGIGALAGKAAQASGPIVRGLVTGALGSAGTTAAEAAVAGKPMEEGLKDTGMSALSGGALGGGIGAVQAAGRAIKNSAGAKARELIEKYGGKVGMSTPGSGGAFDQELAGLEPNDRGIGQASRGSAERVLGRLDTQFDRNVAGPYRTLADAADAGPGKGRTADMTPVYNELMSVYDSERLTPSERSLLAPIIDRMERSAINVGNSKMVVMSERDANDFRGMLQDLSGVGKPGNPTVADVKLQGAAREAKGVVDQGPYAKANELYSRGARSYGESRNMLDIKSNPRTNPSNATASGLDESEVAKLGNALARQDQNTVTAGVRNADRFDRFVAKHPEAERDIELPEVLRAKADLQFRGFGNAGHGGLINRLPDAVGLPALAVGAATNHGPAGLAALGATLAAKNATPLAGRLLYSPAQVASEADPAGAIQAIIGARAAERELSKKRAKRLKGEKD